MALDFGLPDIILPPGDNSPNTRVTLLDASDIDGQDGPPMDLLNVDLTPKTVIFRYQNRAGGAPVDRACTVIQTSATVNRGVIDIPWKTTGGGVSPAGSNWRCRFIVTDNQVPAGQETLPRGPDIEQDDGSNPSFYWLQVSRDFSPA